MVRANLRFTGGHRHRHADIRPRPESSPRQDDRIRVFELADGRSVVATAEHVAQILADPEALIGFDATDTAAGVQSRIARFSDGPSHEQRAPLQSSDWANWGQPISTHGLAH